MPGNHGEDAQGKMPRVWRQTPQSNSRKGVFGSGEKGIKSYKILETSLLSSCIVFYEAKGNLGFWIQSSPCYPLFSLLQKVGVLTTAEARCLVSRFRTLDWVNVRSLWGLTSTNSQLCLISYHQFGDWSSTWTQLLSTSGLLGPASSCTIPSACSWDLSSPDFLAIFPQFYRCLMLLCQLKQLLKFWIPL